MKQQAPRRRVGWRVAGTVLLLAIAAWWLAGTQGSPEGSNAGPARPITSQQAQLPCSKLLSCAAGRAIEAAGMQCRPQIEQLAAFALRWINRPGDSIFTDYVWLQPDQGTITFLGRHAEFQDAGGRFGPVAYECDYDPATQQVLNVRAMTAGG